MRGLEINLGIFKGIISKARLLICLTLHLMCCKWKILDCTMIQKILVAIVPTPNSSKDALTNKVKFDLSS